MKVAAATLILFALSVPVSAEVATASLALSEQQLSFVAEIDGPRALKTVRLNSQSLAPWKVKTSADWLLVAPASGSGSQDLTIGIKSGVLAPGTYTAELLLGPVRPPYSLLEIQVQYTLKAAQGISVYAGDDQTGVINSTLKAPFVARVTDQAGEPLAGIAVSFSTQTGATEPATLTVTSDTQGLASFQPKVLQYGAVQVTASTETLGDAPAQFRAVVTGWLSDFAGDGIRAYGGDDGPAGKAHLNAPFGMVLKDGQLIVVDYFNHALRSIDLDTNMISPLIGDGKQGFNGDGRRPLESVINGPFGIALNPSGEIVFSDYYNHRIRKLDRDNGTLTTLAGTGIAGYSGDAGQALAAEIDVPLDVASDSKGNIYLSDWHHNVVRRLEVKSGIIDTIAGKGMRAYTGEGPATAAALAVPLGMSFDQYDNLYIADYGNNRVRKIEASSGLISTVAGTGRRGFSGDGGPGLFARLNRPYNVYADHNGGLFISDAGNHRLRHLDLASGVITTVAGNGQFGYSRGSELAVHAALKGAFSVIQDKQKNLYIAEYFGQRIRKIGALVAAVPAEEALADRLLRQSRQIFGQLPQEATSADNPLGHDKVALGRALFHEAQMSADGTVSCSSCHPLNRYGMDSIPLAVGIGDQRGDRNTPSVFNAALQDSQFWDGRVASVEAQVREPLLHPKEMAMPDEAAVISSVRNTPGYQDKFSAAFPEQKNPVTMENISLALGAFQRRLLTPDAAFDRFIAGDKAALSSIQLRGLDVFLREGCASCHAGPLLGGQDLHLDQSYPNNRYGDQFEFRKRFGNTHKFKVAPLRNIARTAPYLHDGRYATLEQSLGDRLLAYMVREGGIRETVDIGLGELDALVAFLQSLTGIVDQEYIRPNQDKPYAVPPPDTVLHSAR